MTSFHAGGLSAIAQRPPSFGVPSLVNQVRYNHNYQGTLYYMY
jgi:hypothetical protein